MKAITSKGKGEVTLSEVPKPEKISAGYILIEMTAMGINAGDKFFISGNFPPGMFTQSRHDIKGVSGVGKVIALGEGVPNKYWGKFVTVYRSLTSGDEIVGTWSEYAHLPYLQCAILPDDVDPHDYSGSLVNIVTAYGAYKQAVKEGHQGIVITAGNSDTGRAMLGFCLNAGFPVISIVRNDESKTELKALGASHVLIQGTDKFNEYFAALSAELKTTAVFDGVGGTLVSELLEIVPAGTTFYAYGFLGGDTPVSFHTRSLIKGITIKGFSNFKTETVLDHQQLAEALDEISEVIHMPHFRFNMGTKFTFDQIDLALAFTDSNGAKALLKTGR
jgi:NADPH:quinone reductase-like Zn-dependent oxidoreductase